MPKSSTERVGSRVKLPEQVLAWTAQLVSIAGVVAFLIAIALNSLVFSAWGLNFLQLASLSDAINSGLVVFLALAPGIAAVLAAVGLGRMPFSDRRRAQVAVVSRIAIVLCIVGVAIFGIETSSRSPLGTAFFAFVLTLHLSFSPDEGRGFRPLTILFALGLAISSLTSAIGILRSTGFNGELTVQASRCPGSVGRVMWIGERAMVLNCLNVRKSRRQLYVVIIQPEDLDTLPLRRTRAEAVDIGSAAARIDVDGTRPSPRRPQGDNGEPLKVTVMDPHDLWDARDDLLAAPPAEATDDPARPGPSTE